MSADAADLLARVDEACEVAQLAFSAGDNVTGIAAITLAAELVQLAKIFSAMPDGREVTP